MNGKKDFNNVMRCKQTINFPCNFEFQCIPITEDFGIIEMIDNVMSLREVIFDTPELVNKRLSLTKTYDRWIKDACSSERPSALSYDHYRIAAKTVDRDRFVQRYDKTVGELPKYLLR